MNNTMTSENLLCGYQLISVGNKAEIRKSGLPLQVVYRGTYRACKAEAKRRGLLMSQAPFRGEWLERNKGK